MNPNLTDIGIRLSPSAIVAAARRGLVNRGHNIRTRLTRSKLKRRGFKKAALSTSPKIAEYLFDPRHVNNASSVSDLIKKAIEGRNEVLTRAVNNEPRLDLYNDYSLLSRALEYCCAGHDEMFPPQAAGQEEQLSLLDAGIDLPIQERPA